MKDGGVCRTAPATPRLLKTVHELRCAVFYPDALHGTVLSLYLEEGRGVQENTIMRSREFPRPNAGIFLYSPSRVNVQILSNL